MSDDNLETLSNTELHHVCIEYGFKNVPVTDSSRKVIIKRLRQSIGSGDISAVATPSPKKSSGRRETIAATTKAATNSPSVKEPNVAKSSTSVNTRRTLAATPPIKLSAEETREISSIKSTDAITKRRSATRERSLPKLTPAPTAITSYPTVVIEDDEEDEDVLAAVAAEAEFHARRSKPLPSQQHYQEQQAKPQTREFTLSKTSVVTNSYAVDQPQISKSYNYVSNARNDAAASTGVPATAGLYPDLTAEVRQNYKESHTYVPNRFGYTPPVGSVGTSPYDSNYTKGYGYGSGSTVTNKRSYDIYNELSDGNDEDQIIDDDDGTMQTPFLSKFMQELERAKQTPLRGTSSSGNTYVSPFSGDNLLSRRSQAAYVTSAPRRSIKTGVAGTGDVSLREFILRLERQYHLKRWVYLLVLLLVVLFIARLYT